MYTINYKKNPFQFYILVKSLYLNEESFNASKY